VAVALNVYHKRLMLGRSEMVLLPLNLSGLKQCLLYSSFKSMR